MDFELELASFLDRNLAETPSRLADSIRYSTLSPGKRIRPKLVIATAHMLDLPQSMAMPMAIAIELGHASTLVHDDLPCMDDDSLRRGQPTNHIVYGESMALLAGDSMLMLSISTLAELGVKTSAALEVLTKALGPSGVMGGQAMEDELLRTPSSTGLQRMHQLKTGALFEAAIMMPVAVSGIPPADSALLQNFARGFGQAFQILDDLADKESSPKAVLYYLSEPEALVAARHLVETTSAPLEARWGKLSQPLVSMASSLFEPWNPKP